MPVLSVIFWLFSSSLVLPLAYSQQHSIASFSDDDLDRYRTNQFVHSNRITVEANEALQKQPLSGPASLFDRSKNAVVSVTAYGSSNQMITHGSGFFISEEGLIATSYHTVRGSSMIKVKTADRIHTVSGIVFIDRDNDIAILKVDGFSFPSVKLGDSSHCLPGDKVYLVSIPDGCSHVFSEGTVSEIMDFSNKKGVMKITVPFGEGSSGAPLISADGHVCGIAAFVINDVKRLGFAVPIDRIRHSSAFLKSAHTALASSSENAIIADNWLTIGSTHYKNGNYADAQAAYIKALEVDPGLSSAYAGVGLIQWEQKNYTESISSFQKALSHDPESAVLHTHLGLVYAETGLYHDAVAELLRTIDLMPNLESAYFNLGNTYRKMGLYNKASDAYSQALRLNPDFAEARFGLVMTLIDLHEREKALTEFAILQDLNPQLAQKLQGLIRSY